MSENWDFYMAKVDHKSASIMVDLGINRELPYPNHSFMSYLRVYMRNPRPDGLSSKEEYVKLCEIGDAIKMNVEHSNHIYVGRNTSDGTRDFYFYTPDPKELLNSLNNMMRSFKQYQFEIDYREDNDWKAYHEFLYPDRKAMQKIMNRRVCEHLRDKRDNNDLPRKIDHWAYFNSSRDIKSYITFLKNQNFTILGNGRDGIFNKRRYVNFERVDIPAEINDLVESLYEKAERFNGSYDGWGCEVRKK